MKFTPSYGPVAVDDEGYSADGLTVLNSVPSEALIRILEHRIGKDGAGLRHLKTAEAMVALEAFRQVKNELAASA